MQYLITSKARDDFDAKVNSVLFDGATIVPGTLAIGMVAFQKPNGDTYLQSRYTAVVELTTEQNVCPREYFREVAQAAIAGQDAQAACGCGSSDGGDGGDDGDNGGLISGQVPDDYHYPDAA